MYQINAGPQTDAFRFGRVSFIELVLGQPGIDFLEKGLAASVEIFAKILDMVHNIEAKDDPDRTC